MTEAEFLAKLNEMKGADLREAMTRTEYQAYMYKGVRGLLDGAYAKAALNATFMELVVEDTSDSMLERYPSAGDPQMPQKVNEGQPFPVLSPGSPDLVNVTNYKYGGVIEISTEVDEDDQSPAKELRKQGSALGRKHVEYKDKAFYSIMTANGNIYDGQAFFSLNHPGYTGGAARANNDNLYTAVTMSANALATVLGIVAKWEGADPNQDLSIQAERIVCPVTLQQTAFGLTKADLLPFGAGAGPLGPGATVSCGMPNMMKGKLQVTSSPRLDKTSVTDWYVKTDFPGILYLKRKGLQLFQELPNSGKSFDQGLLRWRTEERFGAKVINWRGMLLIS
jgi:hypothetical protein